MAFSGMSSKEKTIIVILGVVILVALVGIGVLVARMVTGDKVGEKGPEITVAPTTVAEATSPPVAEETPAPTQAPPATKAASPPDEGGAPPAGGIITPITPPSLEELGAPPPPPPGDQPAVVVHQESLGPLAPVIIANQPLAPGRRYRIEIVAADGSKAAIQGSWGQTALSASGQVAAPQIEFFEGATPHTIDVVAPVPDPTSWSCSVSAAAVSKDLLKQPPGLVIRIWDMGAAP